MPLAGDTYLEQSVEEYERERSRRVRVRLMMIGAGVCLFIGEFHGDVYNALRRYQNGCYSHANFPAPSPPTNIKNLL